MLICLLICRLWLLGFACCYCFQYCFVFSVTYVLLKVIDAMMGLRVSRDDEEDGLDLTQHNERGYDL